MLRVTKKRGLDFIPVELIQSLGSQAKPCESEGSKVPSSDNSVKATPNPPKQFYQLGTQALKYISLGGPWWNPA